MVFWAILGQGMLRWHIMNDNIMQRIAGDLNRILIMASQTAAKVAQATNRVIGVNKKYTLQSTGIWETIRRIFAVDPTRSNGVPLNPQFRNPPPGSNEPFSFIDPVTLPAGDIAENPYWKRDSRRNYPQLSFCGAGGCGGAVERGERGEAEGGVGGGGGGQGGEKPLEVFGKGGLPPTPSGVSLREGADKYHLTEENAYPEQYPCRTFK
ncbi:hypothetical protein EYC84_005946 [Monilinia fructicola]|uniref:NADH-ubiquinone oxidoreductase 21.3 kDa subunit n=1 Tax=Monilinia fructicola TaxID=38448 RepID=A0A5M9JZ38_MONFR|nr:hypothetical protein EYC84_005946 [Monilinia fructicola]